MKKTSPDNVLVSIRHIEVLEEGCHSREVEPVLVVGSHSRLAVVCMKDALAMGLGRCRCIEW